MVYMTVELAATPVDEPCAQVGDPDYGEKARRECRAYVAQLKRIVTAAGKEVPPGARIVVKTNAHDYGTYHEVAVRFCEDDEEACDFAFWLENNQPATWDDEARAELGLADGVAS